MIGLSIVLYLFTPWFRPTDSTRWNAGQARLRLHRLALTADSVGIDTIRYTRAPADSEAVWQRTMTALLLDVRYGHRPDRMRYAGLPETPDTTGLRAALTDESYQTDWLKTTNRLPYSQLVAAYTQQRTANAPADSLRAIRQTLNFYRYLNRFQADRLAVVNIPAAALTVFDKTGNRLLPMAVIVGKKDKRTPTFTAYLTEVTMYPYWNVPRGIGIKEILPKVQADVSYLDAQNIEVLDDRDKPADAAALDWGSFSAENFPYRFRQASGCDNSLGLLKFKLSCPFDIYLHDTNARDLFDQTTNRWRSHGCVRLQKPVELANFVLNEPKFDAGFMNRCLIDQKPQVIALPTPFPVVIAYNLADIGPDGRLVFYADVYGLTR